MHRSGMIYGNGRASAGPQVPQSGCNSGENHVKILCMTRSCNRPVASGHFRPLPYNFFCFMANLYYLSTSVQIDNAVLNLEREPAPQMCSILSFSKGDVMKNCLPAFLILLAALPVAAQAVPPQKLKNAMELSYAAGDGRTCVAHLETSDCELCGTPAQSTHDPLWITSCGKDKQEWLGYKGADGKRWWAYVEALANDDMKGRNTTGASSGWPLSSP